MVHSSDLHGFGKTLGANLRRIRTERRLTLSTLGERSGVAKATLAKLEQGRGNPTIDTVWALALGLGVTFADLFEQPDAIDVRHVRADEGSHVVSHLDAPALDLRLLDRLTRSGMTEVYEMTLVAGGHQDGQSHGEGVVERVFVSTGRMLAGPADAPVELGPGDFLRYPADRPHVYTAVEGSCRGVLLVEYGGRARRAGGREKHDAPSGGRGHT